MKPQLILVAGTIGSILSAAAEPVYFNEHIRPILADNCFACHGVDAAHRKGKRRLDRPDGATVDRDGVRAIVSGNLEKSELWQRIISPHEDEIMPPPESHKPPLKPEQRTLIKRWIEEGAVYQDHWAFEPVSRPELPRAAGGAANHPVDRFVGARLAPFGLALAPEAPRDVLFRRLTLDLTGLPPTVPELDAFLADGIPGAYERAIDRLLSSPHYGEHFGRFWLDAVRYGDTHGLHVDNVRDIWPYRDWVVQAFNRNLSFDQFTIEQLAGDLLPNPRTDQLVATGYNRNILTTSEGGTIEAEAEMRNTADRVDTTAAVWMGLTANCASCHDHKFDPLSQKEYYSLGAIFKGLADRVWDGSGRVAGPITVIANDPATQKRIDALPAAIAPLEAAVAARADELMAGEVKPLELAKTPIRYEVVWAEDSDLPTSDNVLAAPAPGEWRRGENVPVAGGQRALRLEGPVARPIAFTAGDVDLIVRTEAKAFVHVNLDPANPPRAISIEFISDEKTKRAIWGDPGAFGPEGSKHAVRLGPLPEAGRYARLEFTACESGIDEGRTYTGLRIAQSDGAAWWDRIGAVLTSPSALDDPLLSKDAWVRSFVTHREGSYERIERLPLRHDVKFLVSLSNSQKNEAEKKQIVNWHRDYIYAPLRAALEPEAHAVRRLLAEQIHYEMTFPVTPISRERAEPLPAHVMIRGQYDKPGERALAATPAFLPPIKTSGERVTRLDFARWLVAPENPLTARVTVNRFWQQLFGAGLVRTPGDFGNQGDPPTHPDLVDWLADEFQRTGWDVKRLVRLLVTSRTYRQSSRADAGLLERDPENKLLARGSRHRLDAEVLRDQALAVSGLLEPAIGGPPVRPYQPPNIWEPIAYTLSNTRYYEQNHGAALYRRSLYTFWKRTAPPPSMSTFDAPTREAFCVVRGRSNTPLQALALMNDVQHVEAARALAERLLRDTLPEAERLAIAFRNVTARLPDSTERGMLARTLAVHRAHFERNLEEAGQLIRNGESKPAPTLPVGELAAWTVVANLLLNLDETLTRN